MNLQSFFNELAADEPTQYEAKDLVQRAKERGLILAPGEAKGLQTALAAQIRKTTPIDKSGGKLVTELAGVKTRWMDVTPAMAELWLLNNFGNRKVSEDTVRTYAREMRNGKWLPTHQGIAFNDRDELIDGQHRLKAVALSECTVRMMVTFGMPSKVKGSRMTGMDTVDRGKPRSVADQLKIQHGMKDGTLITSICTRIAGMCTPERTRRLTVGEILDIHDTFREGVDWIIPKKPKIHGLKQAGVLAAFAFARCVQTEAEAYWEMLLDDGTGPNQPMSRLREFLTSDAAILLGRGNDRALAELVLQALFLQTNWQQIEELTMSVEGLEYYRSRLTEPVSLIRKIFEVSSKGVMV